MSADLPIIALGAFVAALAIGTAGFAFSMVATGFWIYVLPPPTIVFMAATCGTLLHGISVWRYRREIDYHALRPFLVGGFIGVPIGVYALSHIDIAVFRHLIGGLMIAYGGYTLLRPQFRPLALSPAKGRAADSVVGWLGGILGGLSMLNGVLPTIWCGIRGWDKRQARYVYQPFILYTGVFVMLLSGINVRTDLSEVAWYIAVSLPALGAGLWLGLKLFERVSDVQFRRLLAWLILLSGISLQF